MTQPKEQILAEWQSLVSAQQESGQTMAAFCRARELHTSQFYYWNKRLREAATPQFVEVRVAKQHLSQRDFSALGSTIEVCLSNGRSLVVAANFDASHLRALLAVVESES